jgi:hypothetical protein
MLRSAQLRRKVTSPAHPAGTGRDARGRHDQAQLRATIRWEPAIIALQGTFLGLLVGVFFGWALVTVARLLAEQRMPRRIPVRFAKNCPQ